MGTSEGKSQNRNVNRFCWWNCYQWRVLKIEKGQGGKRHLQWQLPIVIFSLFRESTYLLMNHDLVFLFGTIWVNPISLSQSAFCYIRVLFFIHPDVHSFHFPNASHPRRAYCGGNANIYRKAVFPRTNFNFIMLPNNSVGCRIIIYAEY